MNPTMIPLDAANSSIPCALLRLTARNPGNKPVEVAFIAALQNAVGNGGAQGLTGVRHGGYGGNRNRVVRSESMTAIAMDKAADPVASGPVKTRTAAGKEVPGPELHWIAGLSALTADDGRTLGANRGRGRRGAGRRRVGFLLHVARKAAPLRATSTPWPCSSTISKESDL